MKSHQEGLGTGWRGAGTMCGRVSSAELDTESKVPPALAKPR